MRKIFSLSAVLSIGFALFALSAVNCGGDEKTVDLNLGGKIFSLEIADTDMKRQRGLMYRKSLPDDRGMLFLFERDQQLSFWMKNTYVPLSIAFITKDGTVKEIFDLTPESLRPVESTFLVRMALELPKGSFAKLGIGPGSKIDLPEEISSRLR